MFCRLFLRFSTLKGNVLKFQILSPTAIPCRMHRISFDLRSEAAQGPVSTRVGDCLGRPQGAVGFFAFSSHPMRSHHRALVPSAPQPSNTHNIHSVGHPTVTVRMATGRAGGWKQPSETDPQPIRTQGQVCRSVTPTHTNQRQNAELKRFCM